MMREFTREIHNLLFEDTYAEKTETIRVSDRELPVLVNSTVGLADYHWHIIVEGLTRLDVRVPSTEYTAREVAALIDVLEVAAATSEAVEGLGV